MRKKGWCQVGWVGVGCKWLILKGVIFGASRVNVRKWAEDAQKLCKGNEESTSYENDYDMRV
jgi:hypothetical protein